MQNFRTRLALVPPHIVHRNNGIRLETVRVVHPQRGWRFLDNGRFDVRITYVESKMGNRVRVVLAREISSDAANLCTMNPDNMMHNNFSWNEKKNIKLFPLVRHTLHMKNPI